MGKKEPTDHQMQIVLYNIYIYVYVYLNSFLPLLFFFCSANSFISLRIRISGDTSNARVAPLTLFYMDRLLSFALSPIWYSTTVQFFSYCITSNLT